MNSDAVLFLLVGSFKLKTHEQEREEREREGDPEESKKEKIVEGKSDGRKL